MEASWEIFQHLHMIIAQVNKLTTASWETLSQKHPAKLCTFEWKFFRTNASLVLVVQSLSRVQLLATPWTAAGQASLSFTISWSLLKLMSTESMMPSNHLILCCPLLLLPSVFLNIRVFSNESALLSRWPKYWGFSFSTSPSSEHSGLISFMIDWCDILQFKGLSRVFSSTTVWKDQFFSSISLEYMPRGRRLGPILDVSLTS